MFAYLNGYYHVHSSRHSPLFFEEYEDFSVFGSKNKNYIWTKTKIFLGLLAKNIDYQDIRQIRLSQDTIKIFSDNLLGEYEYGRCHIFDSTAVLHENEVLSAKEPIYKVIDDFQVNRLGKDVLPQGPLKTKDDFVSDIYLYNSFRVLGSKFATDAVAISHMKRKQLYEFDYSDTMAMFKLKRDLNNFGFLGIKEKGTYKNGSSIYKKIKVMHVKRITIEQDNNLYKDTERVKFLNMSMKEVFDGAGPKK